MNSLLLYTYRGETSIYIYSGIGLPPPVSLYMYLDDTELYIDNDYLIQWE